MDEPKKSYKDHFTEACERAYDIGDERFKREYLNDPIDVCDGARLDEMHKKILRLEDRIGQYALAKTALEVDNAELRTENKMLLEENDVLKIELDKVHSRFEILDL